MINFQVVPVRPAYMGQSITVTPTPSPAVVAPAPSKMPSTPALLTAAIVGGATLGFIGTIIWQKADKRMQQGSPMRTFGALGGALGGLAGLGTTLLLKD